MTVDQRSRSFVVIFRNELLLGFLPKALAHSFHADGVEFASESDNHLTAFWDRLVDSRGELVGVQVSPTSEAAERLMLAIRRAAYVTSEPGAFQVWFSEAPIEGVRNSGEQAFGGQVFTSVAGDLALSIDADSLFTAADEERLAEAHGKWTNISTSINP